MSLRILIQTRHLALSFLLFVFSGLSINAEESALSLREAIREVSEVVNVLPLDVYAGTTEEEYGNWNIRFDLTYREFRPNYVLYLIARTASVKEVLECVEELPKMEPKEKALTCAALIAFVGAQRERKAYASSQTSSDREIITSTWNEDEKNLVLQKLKQELNDRETAFSKVENKKLTYEWEYNLREECSNFMMLSLGYDGITATKACRDSYYFPGVSKRFEDYLQYEAIVKFGRYGRTVSTWNTETKQLRTDFLCALVLAQSTFEREDFDYKFFEQKDIDKKKVFCEKLEIAKRDAVVSCFNYCKTSVTYKVDDNSRDSYPKRDEKWGGKGECLIMNAYLKTQYIGARLEQGPICGNSFPRDLLVSKVVQKAIDAVLSEPTDNDTGIVSETKDVMKDVDQGARLSLLESIQKNAESAEFFSLPLFIRMFQKIDQNQPCFFGSCVFFALTYERFRPFGLIYEGARVAAHDEIVECLNAFDDLSTKEKAFVLAAATLYIIRSESPAKLKSLAGDEELEPLSEDEKRIFSQKVLDSDKDIVAFEGVRGSFLEWESSIRKNALEFQKKLGGWNPYYNYSGKMKERWELFCNEAPVVLLYSMLAMELRCDLDELRSALREKRGYDPICDRKKELEWTREIEDEELLLEIRMMRYYLFSERELANRDPYFGTVALSAGPPPPRYSKSFDDVLLSEVSRVIVEIFPSITTDRLPKFDPSRYFLKEEIRPKVFEEDANPIPFNELMEMGNKQFIE